MNQKRTLRSPQAPGIEFESIDARHLELLRRLKNANRGRFFFQNELTTEDQRRWFSGYLQRPGDGMFIIRHEGVEAACIGHRTVDGAIDLYNFLRDDATARGSDFAAVAVEIFCSYLVKYFDLPIRANVLASNPASRWARKLGFTVIGQGTYDGHAYQLVELDRRPFPKYDLEITTDAGTIPDSVALA